VEGGLLSAIALVVSLGAAVLSYGETRRQRKIADHQTRLQRDLDLIHWAQDSVEHLVEAWAIARALAEGAVLDSLRDRLGRAQAALSAAADKGRFYLPNIEDGKQRPGVMPDSRRGYRHAALDELVAVYEALERVRGGEAAPASLAEDFFENRRWFIDAVVDEIRPALHVAFVQRVTDRQKYADRPKPRAKVS
jgi:hypothetical protein